MERPRPTGFQRIIEEDRRPVLGVFYVNDRHTHETKMNAQVALAKQKKGPGDLDALLRGENVWTIG